MNESLNIFATKKKKNLLNFLTIKKVKWFLEIPLLIFSKNYTFHYKTFIKMLKRKTCDSFKTNFLEIDNEMWQKLTIIP